MFIPGLSKSLIFFSFFYIICNNFFFFPEYKVTVIDSIKEYAVTDAYLRLFKILYLCGKVNPFMFRQKLQLLW